MSPTVAALLGSAIGASSGVLAVLTGSWYQSVMEHRRWIRDQKAEAYRAALQSLYRLTNRRSYLMADGKPVLAREHQKEWFDDYIAMTEALGALAIYARGEFMKTLYAHAYTIRTEFEVAIAGNASESTKIHDLTEFRKLTEAFEDDLVQAAVRDLALPG